MLAHRFNLVGKIKVKRLLKTYYECRRKQKNTPHYIQNFDTMDVIERRSILAMLIGESRIKGLSDNRINQLFEMKISAAVRELEKDLANPS